MVHLHLHTPRDHSVAYSPLTTQHIMKYLKKKSEGKPVTVAIGERNYRGIVTTVDNTNSGYHYVIFRIQRTLENNQTGKTGYMHLFFHKNGKVYGLLAQSPATQDAMANDFQGYWNNWPAFRYLRVQLKRKHELTINMA